MGEEVLVDTFAVAVRSVESLREGLRLKNGRSLKEAAMRDFGSFNGPPVAQFAEFSKVP